MAGCHEHGNEPLVFTKCGKCLRSEELLAPQEVLYSMEFFH